MTMEEALLNHLQTQSTLTNLTGKRIYYSYAPDNVLLPYLVINKISGTREQTFGNVPGVVYGRYQFTVIDDDYPTVKSVLNILNTTSLLKDFNGIMGTSSKKVDFTSYDNELDLSIDPSLNLYMAASEWSIAYHE